MSTIIELVAIIYVSVHATIFLATFLLIARTNHGLSLFGSIRKSFLMRPELAIFSMLHFIDVGTDLAVIFGWYFEQNEHRKAISYHGILLLFALGLYAISKITSSLYIYGVTREILPTILQFFDVEIYYDIYFDQNCTTMDIKIEQLYRSFAVLQSFPMAIIQTHFLAAYPLVADEDSLDDSDRSYILMTFISLLVSILFILCLQTNHDTKFLNTKDRMMSCGMPKWFIRVLYRTSELLSRILLLTYIWILYGIIAIWTVLTLEWFFNIYNHYKKDRYDNSSEHSIRMWRKQNKFFLWPLVFDELISFWNFDWKLPALNSPTQRSCDIIDILQGWTFASMFYGIKYIRKLTREKPPCDCKRPMDEYFSAALEPVNHFQQMSVETGRATNIDFSKFKKPICLSCRCAVAINAHYFRCPTFLQSGSIEDETTNEKITKHGRYLCIHCGYARMTYLPFLFVYSRNIFTWIYVAVLTLLASAIEIDCNILCIDDGTSNNMFHKDAYQSELFLAGISFHFLCPLFFVLILTTKQMKLREIEAKSFDGKVIKFARKLQWDKVYELIRHEDCDVNEVDRNGRSALLFAAISHNFQVIRDLQQFGADMDHVDINSCGIKQYLDTFNDSYDEYDDDKDDNIDRCTGPTRAAKNGSNEDLHLCLELGCDMNKEDGNGHTPLLIACKEREIGIIKILINHANTHGASKVNLNKPDKLGRTAVIISTQYGYDDVLEILLNEAQNIDVIHRDNEGISAFEHAISCNQKKCAKLIHQYKKQHDIVETKVNSQQDLNDNAGSETEEEVHETAGYVTQNGDGNNTNIVYDDKNGSTKTKKSPIPIDNIMVLSDTEDGDTKMHPVATSDNDMGTPSKIELHESDSIDRRIYRTLSKEKAGLEKNGGNEDDDNDEVIIKGKTMSIVITDVDAIHAN